MRLAMSFAGSTVGQSMSSGTKQHSMEFTSLVLFTIHKGNAHQDVLFCLHDLSGVSFSVATRLRRLQALRMSLAMSPSAMYADFSPQIQLLCAKLIRDCRFSVGATAFVQKNAIYA